MSAEKFLSLTHAAQILIANVPNFVIWILLSEWYRTIWHLGSIFTFSFDVKWNLSLFHLCLVLLQCTMWNGWISVLRRTIWKEDKILRFWLKKSPILFEALSMVSGQFDTWVRYRVWHSWRFLYEWMSEYIRTTFFDKNESSNKYLYWKLHEYSSRFYTLTHSPTNVWIYSYK